MNENEQQIELKSPAVQEILGRPPRWIIRWGISIIFIVVAGLVVGSYFFKYPDVINATITVSTENLPAGLMAKTTGRIDTLLVKEKQKVKQGELLAVIENPARFEDVMSLKEFVTRYGLQVTSDSLQVTGYELQVTSYDLLTPHTSHLLPHTSAQLGEIQPAYQQFIKSLDDYQYFIQTDYHHKKIKVIQKQIKTQNLILSKSKNQLFLSNKQLEAAYQIFTIDSNLYEKNVLSNAEYQNSKNLYLQHLQSFENAKLNIDNQNMSILQSEQTYLLISQIEGVVTLTNYGKELTFSQEMTGTAEIITEDLRLLDKFLNPIKAVIKEK